MCKNVNALKTQYEDLKNKISNNDNKIEELLKDEKVKNYLKIINENYKLKTEKEKIYLEIKKEKMSTCSHVFVIGSSKEEWDGHTSHRCQTYFCIKCGLDTSYAEFEYQEILQPIQREMIGIYRKTVRNGVLIPCICSPVMAKEIYNKIIIKYPNVDDRDLIELFKLEFCSITNKKISKRLLK